MTHTILVTGATGTVGNEVVKELLNKDVKIKVGVRDVSKLQNEPWVNQVELVTLDYGQAETIKNALVNVDKLFLLTPPGTCGEKEIAESVLEQSEQQGLQHIVRLSSMGADEHNIFRNQYAADTFLLASGIDYTALKANSFMQNFYNYLTSIKEQQKIIEPAGDGKTSFIDARDIAAVAAIVLTEPGHTNQIYELTGGEALTYYQVADLFTEILGKEIVYQPLSNQEYLSVKAAEGIPAEFSERFTQFFQMVRNDEYARVSPVVERMLARPPTTLKQFISDYRERFI